jgi:hypothetical protein
LQILALEEKTTEDCCPSDSLEFCCPLDSFTEDTEKKRREKNLEKR